MDEPKPEKSLFLFNVGDRVKIHHTEWQGRIVELRGPLAPGGVQVYRVLYGRKPVRRYIEVMENQLKLIPPEPVLPATGAEHGNSSQSRRKTGGTARTARSDALSGTEDGTEEVPQRPVEARRRRGGGDRR
jgi:hypothetical protein